MDEIGQIFDSIAAAQTAIDDASAAVAGLGDEEIGEAVNDGIGAPKGYRPRKLSQTQAGKQQRAAQSSLNQLKARVNALEALVKKSQAKAVTGKVQELVSNAGRRTHLTSQAATATASTSYSVGKVQDTVRANVFALRCSAGTVTITSITIAGVPLTSATNQSITLTAGDKLAFNMDPREVSPQNDIVIVFSASAIGDKLDFYLLFGEDPQTVSGLLQAYNN